MDFDKDSTEYVKRGTYFRVIAEENPSTGYKWAFESEGGVGLVQSNYERGVSSALGSPGTRTFTVGVGADGSFHLAQHTAMEAGNDVKTDSTHRKVKFYVSN